ncbi:helix-turn-helix transcriptional regulator [Agromyces sp. NPDC049794]|uniref:helix-turn-helix transcriptional regulator n=1 Tax=unclassified Agromyces TaxID=2639701 RepID=UPI0033C4B767
MPEQDDTAVADSRRWLRDLGALLALPAMWVDHEPIEIATGLLSVLFSVIRLDGAYARFDDPLGDGGALESWRPSGPRIPVELGLALDACETRTPGLTTSEVDAPELGVFRVTLLPLELPWETGLVLVSSGRSDFPTAMETHLLRVAVSQAAIAIHTARRLAREHAARSAAEAALLRHSELLRSLVDDTHASLESISRRIRDAAHFVADVESSYGAVRTKVERAIPKAPSDRADAAHARSPLLHLTRREIETLGLLAQGLSNKEIAGLMWLSDRTVERHITSLYRKIGVARRSEATAYALRHGFA